MVDTFSKETRSKIMANVRGKDTTPEKAVRSLLHKLGFRFRLHDKRLPGKPDICLSKYRTVIFVHGCFWHGHKNCKKAKLPKSNIEFWSEKLQRNIARDQEVKRLLRKDSWNVITIWQCELKEMDRLEKKLDKKIKSNLER